MTSKERATDLLNTTLFHCFDGEEFGLSAKHAVAVADALDTAGVLAPDDAAFRALVETATALGMKLGKAEGRKEAGEEIAQALEQFAANDIRGRADMSIDRAAAIARSITSQPQEATEETP